VKNIERVVDISMHTKASVRQRLNEVHLSMRGFWRDEIYKNGKLIETRGWTPNQVQNTNAEILASLCKNQAGVGGFQYFALGTGLPAWDSSPPTQPYTDTALTTEVFRKAIPVGNITFRGPSPTYPDIDAGYVSPGNGGSNVIQVDTIIGIGEANGNSLREFGIFSGDATATLNSGIPSNWIVHGRIDKDSSISLTRAVRFIFEVN